MQQYKFSLYSRVDFSLKAALMVANAWTFPTEGTFIHLFYCTVEIFYVRLLGPHLARYVCRGMMTQAGKLIIVFSQPVFSISKSAHLMLIGGVPRDPSQKDIYILDLVRSLLLDKSCACTVKCTSIMYTR